MRGLFDVNTLVALFDPSHVHHEIAHEWFGGHREMGWATCPLTENGLVRVISNPAYPGGRTTVSDALERLEVFRRGPDHEFWPDSISLCESGRLAARHVRGHRQLTDVYLLGMAVENSGRLVTFDRSIVLAAVPGAGSDHLLVLGESG